MIKTGMGEAQAKETVSGQEGGGKKEGEGGKGKRIWWDGTTGERATG